MSWHWLDAGTRNQRVRAALAPGGTLAVLTQRYELPDRAVRDAVAGAFEAHGLRFDDTNGAWLREDVSGSECFADVVERTWSRPHEMASADFLRLVRTWSQFLRLTPEGQATVLSTVEAAVGGIGGSVTLDLDAIAVLARRPG
jgi:hypothetical protein